MVLYTLGRRIEASAQQSKARTLSRLSPRHNNSQVLVMGKVPADLGHVKTLLEDALAAWGSTPVLPLTPQAGRTRAPLPARPAVAPPVLLPSTSVASTAPAAATAAAAAEPGGEGTQGLRVP